MSVILNADRPLPEGAQKDIESILDHLDQLIALLAECANQKPDFSPAALFNGIASALSMPFSDVGKMFLALENITEIEQSIQVPENVIPLLEKRLSNPRADKLRRVEKKFAELLEIYKGDHPSLISIKAEKLGYLHGNLYQDGEIITDVRPIFNSAGDSILEMSIIHSLVLTSYSYGVGAKRTHFAMDAIDVLRLRDVCDRAIKKGTTLKEALGGSAWTIKVLNESDRGS